MTGVWVEYDRGRQKTFTLYDKIMRRLASEGENRKGIPESNLQEACIEWSEVWGDFIPES